jgi:hypothetical protein
MMPERGREAKRVNIEPQRGSYGETELEYEVEEGRIRRSNEF